MAINWVADGFFSGDDADEILARIDEQNDQDYEGDEMIEDAANTGTCEDCGFALLLCACDSV